MKKNEPARRKMMRVACVFAVLLVVSVAPASARRPAGAGKAVEMEVKDVYSVAHHSNIVLLKTKRGNTFLPIWIGANEALAISMRLAHQSPPRPLTHDLLEKMMGSLGAKLTKILIEDVRDQVFLGRIFVRRGRSVLQIDARPSDSIALAVGSGAPIFASRRVLERAGLSNHELRVKLHPDAEPSETKVRTEGSL
jgi:bifunctional DNase/RNase